MKNFKIEFNYYHELIDLGKKMEIALASQHDEIIDIAVHNNIKYCYDINGEPIIEYDSNKIDIMNKLINHRSVLMNDLLDEYNIHKL